MSKFCCVPCLSLGLVPENDEFGTWQPHGITANFGQFSWEMMWGIFLDAEIQTQW